MKSFSNETLNFFLQKVLFLLHFGSCQNCMSSANLYIYMYWFQLLLSSETIFFCYKYVLSIILYLMSNKFSITHPRDNVQ